MSISSMTLQEKITHNLAEAKRLKLAIGPMGSGKSGVDYASQNSNPVTPAFAAVLPYRGKTPMPRNTENDTKADYRELPYQPEFHTAASISQLLAKDTSSKEKAINYLLKFCQSRITTLQIIIELHKKGSDDNIKEYYRNLDAVLLSPIEVVRRDNIEAYASTLEVYRTLILLLEGKQLDKAYIQLYRSYIFAKTIVESIKSSEPQYNVRKKFSEYLYYQEVIRTLKPYITYAEQYVRHTVYRFRKENEVLIVITNIVGFFEETVKKISEYQTALKDLFDPKENLFPEKYCEQEVSTMLILHLEFERYTQILTTKSKVDIESDFYSGLYKVERNYFALMEKYKLEHAELSKLCPKMAKFENELKSLSVRFIKKVTDKLSDFSKLEFNNVPNLSEKRKPYTLLVAGRLQAFCEEYKALPQKRIKELFSNFNGDNLAELTEAVSEIPTHIENFSRAAELCLKEIEAILKDGNEKLSSLDKKIKENAGKAEEEDIALLAEHQKRYQAKLQDHQDNIAKVKKEKDGKKAQLKEKNRQELLLLQQAREREEKARAEKAAALTKKIIETKLNKEQEMLLEQIFSDNPPHYTVSYKDIKKLILDLGGNVITNVGSAHHKMQIQVISLGEELCMIDGESDSDNESNTAAATASAAFISPAAVVFSATTTSGANPSAGHSGTLVKPHKAGHNPGLLPQYALKEVRALLERVGLNWKSKPRDKAKP